MSTHKLIKYTADYADEFDCEGFGVFESTKWKSLCEKVEKSFVNCDNVEVSFGTNESLYFDSYESWIKSFSEVDISEEEYNFIMKNFGKTFGTGDNIFSVCGYM